MQPNWQLFLTQLFLNETLHSRIEAPAGVHKEIGDQNGKVPRRMIRLHTCLCCEMSGSRPGYCSSFLAGRKIFFRISVLSYSSSSCTSASTSGLGSVVGGGAVGASGGGAAPPFFCCWRCFLFIFFPAGAGSGGGGARVGFSTLAGAAAGLAGGGEGLENDEAAWAGEGLAGAVAEEPTKCSRLRLPAEFLGGQGMDDEEDCCWCRRSCCCCCNSCCWRSWC